MPRDDQSSVPKTEQPTEPETCPIKMSDGEPCGRRIHLAPREVDARPVCLMHSPDPDKDKLKFREEIDAILNDRSAHHQLQDRYDFTRFVFPKADFSDQTFTRHVVFSRATFTEATDFREATFTERADFFRARFTECANFSKATFAKNAIFFFATFSEKANFFRAAFTEAADFIEATFSEEAEFGEVKFTGGADFARARFTEGASFRRATFTKAADFRRVTFTKAADFREATFTEAVDFGRATFADVADFRQTRFEQPTRVHFFQVNKNTCKKFKAHFLNCRVEEAHFEDVNWHCEGNRMVLQGELNVRSGGSKDQELVAVAYRQLINNFERTRNYERAEDCSIGAMEMRRLDPEHFAWPFRKLYERYRWARKLGELFSVVSAYRILSDYGSSYTRALGVLGFILLVCLFLYPLFGLRMGSVSASQALSSNTDVLCPDSAPISWCRAWNHSERGRELWGTLKAGLWTTFEVGSFQRRRSVEPATTVGHGLAVVEAILIPGQLALLFLALRRRFRR